MFVLIHLIPGGEARAVLGPKAQPVAIAQFDQRERARPPAVGPVPPLPLEPVALRPGPFLHAEPVRRHAHRPGASEDPDPGGPGHPARPRRGDPPGRLPGRAAQQARGLRHHRPFVHPLRRAGVPAGHAADPVVRGLPPDLPDRGSPEHVHHRHPLRSPRARPAGLHPGRHQHRILQPVHAVVDDGDHDRGLRADGPRQGRRDPDGSSTSMRSAMRSSRSSPCWGSHSGPS